MTFARLQARCGLRRLRGTSHKKFTAALLPIWCVAVLYSTHLIPSASLRRVTMVSVLVRPVGTHFSGRASCHASPCMIL